MFITQLFINQSMHIKLLLRMIKTANIIEKPATTNIQSSNKSKVFSDIFITKVCQYNCQ